MPAIDIIDAAGNDYRYNLPEDGTMLTIGTSEDCSISLPHISDLYPQHCTITLQEEGYVITVATPGATLLAESQPTEAAILVPRAVYNIGSAMLMYDDETEPEAPAQDEPRKKKKKNKKSGNRATLKSVSFSDEEGALHIMLRRIYVIAVLAAAFLAGLTFRYWMTTGRYLPDELLK